MIHPPAVPNGNGAKRRFRLSLAASLALAFFGVTLIAAAALAIALYGAQRTTFNLLRDRNEALIEDAVEKLRDYLAPVQSQSIFLADRIIAGDLDPKDEKRLSDFLLASLAGAPQVSAISFTTPDYKSVRAERDQDGKVKIVKEDLSSFPNIAERYDTIRRATGPFWGDLIWRPETGQPLINLRAPVWRSGEFLGGIVALVSMGSLSRSVAQSSSDTAKTFILYDKVYVLAHPRLSDPRNILALTGRTLPKLDQVDDPILAGMRNMDSSESSRLFADDPEGGHVASVGGVSYVFTYRSVRDYGDKPLQVGRYFPLSDLLATTQALLNGAYAGLAALVVALLVGLLMGRAISRPVRRLGVAAGEIQQFEFEGAPLPHSVLIEIDEAAQAVNASRAALKWFANYVPRKLVTRLLAEGDQTMLSKRRDVSVMFTDIVGFTMQAEDLPETETADFLNAHFALVAACIEEEHGVIDKFIGDAVMATWGAIKHTDEHADQACRAALAIAHAVKADNETRRAAGHAPVRVRIGVHSGPVVVGNIGAPGRFNYTVVGDTVNTAQRMEQLGKDYMKDGEDVVVLVSGHALAALTAHSGLPDGIVLPADWHELRGKAQSISVHQLKL
ncbi:MAG: adenylate/guanylate cyclase domain-containing protein [Rhodospirillales bacterium]